MSEKKQEKNVTVKQEETVNGKAVIYLGPAIAGVAMPGTVYRNGITPQLEKSIRECPALEKLLVETGKAQQMRKELQNPQSVAGICYKNVVDYVKKGAKG